MQRHRGMTNLVADSGSAMANQALHGQKVTVGDGLLGGARVAAGTAAFTAGGATFAEGARVTGVARRILQGDGELGTSRRLGQRGRRSHQ
ncbi:hypothetical protein ACFW9M_29165 [Streptomyces lydicus]|uniref:hypothetical protein n=1 Tax=Streptomyces lydicus TaxID=47763 RepID=UPI003690FB7B